MSKQENVMEFINRKQFYSMLMSKPFVIVMPLLLTSWHAGLDRLTTRALLRTN